MKVSLIAFVAALGFAASPVLAADPVYPVIPAGEMAYDWTGPYAGVSLGGLRGVVDVNPPTTLPSGNAATVGVHAGYNWQNDNFVFGVEAGLGYSWLNTTELCTNPAWTCNTRLDWNGSIVGRVGLAADSALFYLTGGVAGANFRVSATNAAGVEFPSSQFRTGWTVGAGVELALTDNMTGRIDYRYADFGSRDLVLDVPYNGVSLKTHSVALGVSFKF